MRTRYRLVGLILSSMVVVSLILSSCTSTSTTAPASATTQAGATPTINPKPTGKLNVAVNFRNNVMDQTANSTPATFQSIGAEVFDSLVELTPDGNTRPGIAERWEIAADGLSDTFFIRKGVKFHDGSDLTAVDVKFTIDRMLAPDALHTDAVAWRGQIASVELKDDYTVVIRLKQALFELPNGFEYMSGSTGIVPKKYIEEKGVDNFRKNPIGSGPFKVVKWDPGNRLDLEAMDSHWRKVPQFKNVSLINVAEEGTKIAMLKTGELDIAEVAPDSVPGLKAAGLRTIVHDGAAQAIGILGWDEENPQKSSMGDVRVRKALVLATNRQEMATTLYGGFAEPTIMVYVRPTAYFWDSTQLKVDPYDAEQAKKLLADAGLPNGFKATIWDAGLGVVAANVSQAIAGYWRKVGVTADVVNIAYTTLTTRYTPKKLPEIYDTLFIPTHGGGIWQFEYMALAYHSTRGAGMPRHALPNVSTRLDQLIEQVPMTKDPAEKKKLATEAAVLAKNGYGTLPLLDVKTVFALSANVGAITPIVSMAGLAPALVTATHGK